jgi:hypothetical protein
MGTWGEMALGQAVSDPLVFERFTESARRAIDFAWQETLLRGGSAISVADLLGGLSVDEDSRAERIGSLKANGFYLRWLVGLPALPAMAVDSMVASEAPPIDRKDKRGGAMELDSEARRALACSVSEADRDRNYWIDSDHLLRGILRFPNTAHFALLKIEISLKSARIASRVDRWENLADQNPSMKVVRYLARKYTMLIFPPALSLACYLYILSQGIGMHLSTLAR